MGLDIAAERERIAREKREQEERVEKSRRREEARQEHLAIMAELDRQQAPPTMACRQCGGEMVKGNHTTNDRSLQSFGCVIALVGICLLIFFPIGTIIGLLLIGGAGSLGYSKKKVWKCRQCGYFFEFIK